MSLFNRGKIVVPNGVSSQLLQAAVIKRGGYTEREEIYSGIYKITNHDAEGCTCRPCRDYRRQLLAELEPLCKEEQTRIDEANCPNQFTVRKRSVLDEAGSERYTAAEAQMRQDSDPFGRIFDAYSRMFGISLPMPGLARREGYNLNQPITYPEEKCPKCEFKPCRLCKK